MNIFKVFILSILFLGLIFACKENAEKGQNRSQPHEIEKSVAGLSRTAAEDEISNKKEESSEIKIRTDPESIEKGRDLFASKCSFCHVANSTETRVGPGLSGILKKPKLPVSKKPATPENIVYQLKTPYRSMPSFSYLKNEDILNIVSYLNTL